MKDSIREILASELNISRNDIILSIGPIERDTLRIIFLTDVDAEIAQDVFYKTTMCFPITNIVAQVVAEPKYFFAMTDLDFDKAFELSWEFSSLTIRN
jgi:hypothetical protein